MNAVDTVTVALRARPHSTRSELAQHTGLPVLTVHSVIEVLRGSGVLRAGHGPNLGTWHLTHRGLARAQKLAQLSIFDQGARA